MRHALAPVALVLAIVLATPLPARAADAATAPTPAKASIGDLAWLAGAWVGGDGGLAFEERWTKPAGGAMLAVARTVKNQKMVGFEFLRIVERDGGVVYVAQPGGQPPTDFVATAVSANGVTFENPAHDFPKRIRYTLLADGRLEARVDAGDESGERYVFTRER